MDRAGMTADLPSKAPAILEDPRLWIITSRAKNDRIPNWVKGHVNHSRYPRLTPRAESRGLQEA